ncbi:hypothetical protein SeMB42_g01933 [Synchytrium endobioticum]|uniref:non-specific serine/threonine protein kinase n=1 Tax=Synchytrium endobioticum TaxID=286115 RepID=A0A507DJ13_9FUNG|nr:hypothetical protein SeMB42_g01933 [Synchytrium endobioticum]
MASPPLLYHHQNRPQHPHQQQLQLQQSTTVVNAFHHAELVNQPTLIGDYVLSTEIGRGSFATVYLASRTHIVRNNGPPDLHPPSPFAVKSVLKDKLNRKLSENLQSEIKILQGLKHPYIVQLLDVVNTDRHIHLIMEYCSMGDLSSFIKRKGCPSNQPSNGPNYLAGESGGMAEFVVRHFLNHLVKSMIFLRQNSLIHRDLKPQNLLLSQPTPGTPPVEPIPGVLIPPLPILKLADFGFARSLASQDMASTLCGSPLYMAPEVLRGDRYDAKADLWSLGAILFEMIYGRPPFQAQSHIDLLKKIDKGDGTVRFPGEDTAGQALDAITSGNSQTVRHVAPSATRPNRALSTSYSRPTPSSGLSTSSPSIVQPSEDLKDLIRQLLKRNPVERMSFEEFFLHPAVQASTPPTPNTPKPSSLSQPLADSSNTVHSHYSNKGIVSSPHYDPTTRGFLGQPLSLPNTFLSTGKAPVTSKRTRSQSLATAEHYTENGASCQQNQQENDVPLPKSYATTTKSPILEMRPLASGNAPSHRNESSGGFNGFTQRTELPSPPPIVSPNGDLEPPFPNYVVDPAAFAAAGLRYNRAKVNSNQSNDKSDRSDKMETNTSSLASLGSIEMSGGSGETDERERIVMLVKKPSTKMSPHRSVASSAPTGAFISAKRTNCDSKAMKTSNLEEYVVVERGAVEVNWLADEVERMVGLGHNQHSISNTNIRKPYDTNGINISRPNPVWAETFKGQRPQPPLPESMHRFLDAPVGQALGHGTRSSSPLQVQLAMLNRCARRGQAVHQFADERLLVANNAAVPAVKSGSNSTSSSTNNSNQHLYPCSDSPHGTPNGRRQSTPVASSARAWAEEALALYIRSLTLYEQGMTVARSVLSTGAQGVNLTSLSAAVAWIRDRFNECLERAELARRVMETRVEGQTSAHSVEKLVHDRALEMAEKAGVSELNGADLGTCGATYAHAALLLEAILQELPQTSFNNNQHDNGLPFIMDGPFDTLSPDDRAAIERFLSTLYFQVSRTKEMIQSGVNTVNSNECKQQAQVRR